MSSGLVGGFKQNHSNVKNVITIYGKLVAAADVDADGYTASGNLISGAAKASEGVATVTITNIYPSDSLVFASAVVDDAVTADTGALASPDVTIGTVSENTSTGGTVQFAFRDAGTLQDPDNHTIWFKLEFAVSGT